jgi:hypothetical protein
MHFLQGLHHIDNERLRGRPFSIYMKYYLLIILSSLSVCSAAQFRNVLIGSSFNPNEPSIAINPKNPKQMVAGANFDNYYTSSDGGVSWQQSRLTSTYGVWGDPIIMVDTAQSFYYFHLSDMSTTHIFGDPGWLDRMVCQRMDNFSGSWSGGTFTGLDSPKAQDKPGVAYDASRNKIYLAWTQFDKYGSASPSDSSIILFSASSDRGQSWSNPVRVSTKAGDCIDDDKTVEGATPSVGPNGEVYMSWASVDGVVFKKSLDGGQTWPGTETLVAALPGGWDYPISGLLRCNGMPFTACDLSNGPYKGTIYINWSDKRNGAQNADIFIAKSTDHGASWSSPIRVNDDTGAGREQFMSAMTIDQKTGYVYVLFYDRRNEVAPNETEVFMAVSKDGGTSFQNHRISREKFVPNLARFLGDYIAISADNGVVRPIWTRIDGLQTSVWTALADSALGIDQPQTTAELQQVYPNPFTIEAVVPFTLSRPCAVSLYVMDMYGRKVATLLSNKAFGIGDYSEHFYANQPGLATGLYMFVLEADGSKMVQKGFYQH